MSLIPKFLYILLLGLLIVVIFVFVKWFNNRLAKKMGGFVVMLKENEMDRVLSLLDEKADFELIEKLVKAKKDVG